MCLVTRLGELQFRSPGGNIYLLGAPGPHRRPRGWHWPPSIGPGLRNNRSRSYASPGAALNKQSTGLRRRCPGLLLVTGSQCRPLIGWHELTPCVSPTSETEIWRTIFIVAKFIRIFSWEILRQQCFACWALTSFSESWCQAWMFGVEFMSFS